MRKSERRKTERGREGFPLMPIRVATLTFDLFVLYYPYLTYGTIAALSSKNSRKEGDYSEEKKNIYEDTVQCKVYRTYTVYSVQYIVQCTVYSTLYSVQCTVQYTLYSTVYSVRTLYSTSLYRTKRSCCLIIVLVCELHVC